MCLPAMFIDKALVLVLCGTRHAKVQLLVVPDHRQPNILDLSCHAKRKSMGAGTKSWRSDVNPFQLISSQICLTPHLKVGSYYYTKYEGMASGFSDYFDHRLTVGGTKRSWRADLNRRSFDYKSNALPLGHTSYLPGCPFFI